MKLKLIAAVAALAAAAAIPGTASAGPVTKADRTNGARACTVLRSAVGATTFALTYRTRAACVTAWTRTAHQRRHAAFTSCRAEGRKGAALSRCVRSRTATRIAHLRGRTINAARACRTERAAGVAAFNQTYGTNANDRNAFGKCVSQKASQPAVGGPGDVDSTQHYTVTFAALNGSGVSGTATLTLKRNELTVTINANGLEASKVHPAHVHGLAERAPSSCNVSTADTNTDGRVSNDEGMKVYGGVMLDLTPFPTASSTGVVAYSQTLTVDAAKLFPLTARAIVLHGLTVNGTYDASLPVACGLITQK